MLSKLEELSLVSRCKIFKDEKAFSRLIDLWSKRIRKFFLLQTRGDEMASDDLAQETFIKVWNKFPELTQVSSFSSWIFRIAYNTWLDHCRRHRKSETTQIADSVGEARSDDSIDNHDLHRLLLKSLGLLTEQERITITLFYLSELSIKEISEVTGMVGGTVKANLSRGRAKLRQSPELRRYYNE